MATSAETLPARGGAAATARALWELSKPGVTRLVMVTTLVGALASPAPIDLRTWLPALLGTALVVASANALNMWWERETDALMERTRSRPLPTGRLSPNAALTFGAVTGVAGLLTNTLLVSPLVGGLALLALVVYVAIYTPLKRVTPWALHVGAVPGALPPVIGWATATGEIGLGGLALFGLLFAWQLPHFLAIAIFRRREYERAGMRVLPAVRGVTVTKVEIVSYSLALVGASLLPAAVGIARGAYLTVALLLGALFFAWSLQGLERDAEERWARQIFVASMPYLVLLLLALVVVAR